MKARVLVGLTLCLPAIAWFGCGSENENADTSMGTSPSGTSAEVTLRNYRSGLEADAADVVRWVAWMESEVEKGNVSAAQSRYAASRVPFGHLKPLLIAFPALNIRLDAQWDEQPEKQLTGFHLVERLLWTEHPMKMRLNAVRGLLSDTEKLQKRVKTAKLDPEAIARRSNEAMNGPVLLALSGNEEPVAHIDMVDLSADIEGVEAASKAIEPLLLERRPELARQIRDRFEHFYEEIAPFGIPAREPEQPRPQAPGVSFVIYTEIERSELQRLQAVLNELIKPLSEVPAALIDPPGG